MSSVSELELGAVGESDSAVFSASAVREHVVAMNRLWSYLSDVLSVEEAVEGICRERMYVSNPLMESKLRAEGVLWFPRSVFDSGLVDREYLRSFQQYATLFDSASADDYFYLANRYLIPVRDLAGNVATIVGFDPSNRAHKYVTIATPYFSKSAYFYGMERLFTGVPGTDSEVLVVVEGMFDRLMLESAGLRCVSTMGLNIAEYKRVLLSFEPKVLFVPDGDKNGDKVVRFDKWGASDRLNAKYGVFPSSVTVGDTTIPLKDPDALGIVFEQDAIRTAFLSAYESAGRIGKIRLF